MKTLWLILIVSGIVLTLLPGILVLQGVIRLEECYAVMGVGGLLWLLSRWGMNRLDQSNKKG